MLSSLRLAPARTAPRSVALSSSGLRRGLALLLHRHRLDVALEANGEVSGDSSSEFDIAWALSLCRDLGAEAAFGAFRWRTLTARHLPCLAFDAQGTVFLVEEEEGGRFLLKDPLAKQAARHCTAAELAAMLAPFAFLLKGPTSSKASSDGQQRQGKFLRASWLWDAFRDSKWLYAQVILAAAVSNVLGLATSLFVMVVYDRVVPNQAIESLVALTIGVLLAVCFDFVIKTLRAQTVDIAGRSADEHLANLIFSKILSLPPNAQSRSAGATASIIREFDALREFFTSATLIAFVDLPFIILFIWVIHLIAGPLAWIPVLAVPSVLLVVGLIHPMMVRSAAAGLASNKSKQAVLVETLGGLETIQTSGLGAMMKRRFQAACLEQSDVAMKGRGLSQLASNTAATVQQVAQVATIVLGTFLIGAGALTLGSLIAAVILGGRALAPLAQMASALSRYSAALQAFRAIDNLMAQGHANPLTAARPYRRGQNGPIKGEFRIEAVSFVGPNGPIVSDLNLTIPAGQRVAVVGKMGSGKSTFTRLLSGSVVPTKGEVFLDAFPLRYYSRGDLTAHLGVMPQEPWLFSGSIRDNVSCGLNDYGEAHLADLLVTTGFERGRDMALLALDRILGERGEGLSGGQKQSLCLARALLRDPPVLLLDEPTSAMDTHSEAAVVNQLEARMRGKTVVLITHRTALMALVDRVLVFEAGRIVADTTPARLLSGATTQ